MSIRVYAVNHEPIRHRPIMHVSRSTAAKWLLQQTHEEIPHTLRAIRMVDPSRRVRVLPSGPAYIPERLPPIELPGLHFDEPDSGAWRRAHRLVTLPRAQSAGCLRAATGDPHAPGDPQP
jgi:hypothetical protein